MDEQRPLAVLLDDPRRADACGGCPPALPVVPVAFCSAVAVILAAAGRQQGPLQHLRVPTKRACYSLCGRSAALRPPAAPAWLVRLLSRPSLLLFTIPQHV